MCSQGSTIWRTLPIHLAQKNSVAELPKTMKIDSSGEASTTAFSTAHLLMSIPKGARNMPAMPTSIMTATCGILMIRPDMASMSRLCSFVLDDADAEEEQALGQCMEDDQQHSRPDGLGRSEAAAEDDQAEIGDGGMASTRLASLVVMAAKIR
jgi:hypothetical protein